MSQSFSCLILRDTYNVCSDIQWVSEGDNEGIQNQIHW
jgi:hypothetical protein